jgi:hypothetical protein
MNGEFLSMWKEAMPIYLKCSSLRRKIKKEYSEELTFVAIIDNRYRKLSDTKLGNRPLDCELVYAVWVSQKCILRI